MQQLNSIKWWLQKLNFAVSNYSGMNFWDTKRGGLLEPYCLSHPPHPLPTSSQALDNPSITKLLSCDYPKMKEYVINTTIIACKEMFVGMVISGHRRNSVRACLCIYRQCEDTVDQVWTYCYILLCKRKFILTCNLYVKSNYKYRFS